MIARSVVNIPTNRVTACFMILPFLLPTEGVRASVEIPLKNIPHIITPPRPSYPGLALAWARPATAAARDSLADVGPPRPRAGPGGPRRRRHQGQVWWLTLIHTMMADARWAIP